MIALSATIADPSGFVEIETATVASGLFGPLQRRITRAATLDGGSAFTDGGFTYSDSIVTVAWSPKTEMLDAAVARIFTLYTRLQLAVRAGVFLVAPQTFTPGTDESSLQVLVVSK